MREKSSTAELALKTMGIRAKARLLLAKNGSCRSDGTTWRAICQVVHRQNLCKVKAIQPYASLPALNFRILTAFKRIFPVDDKCSCILARMTLCVLTFSVPSATLAQNAGSSIEKYIRLPRAS